MGAQGNSFNGCMNCTDRTVEPNCHMTCKVYLNWYDELQRVRKLERQAKQGRHNQFSYSQEKGKHYI